MRRRGKHLEVSTFPFLAVLLCAMGSLILVLLVMDRKAKLAARFKAQAAQAKVAEDFAKADAARLDLIHQYEADAKAAWEQKRDHLHTTLLTQQQILQAQMKKIQHDLDDAAARLKAELDDSGDLKHRVESAKTNLVGEAKSLAAIRNELAETTAKTAADRVAQAKMTADLLQLEALLKDLKEARERDKQTYSVVPYRGKHGENRRPLYVECTRQGLVFHPDRVEIAVAFNPAGARAEVERRVARQKEYLASIQAKTDDKPYLMLLVRPDGINAYYEIQNALRGIDLEFGYEFVDGAWVFDFSKDVDLPPGKPPLTGGPKPAQGSVPGSPRGSALPLFSSDVPAPPGTRPNPGTGTSQSGSQVASAGPGGGNGLPGPGQPSLPTPFREGMTGNGTRPDDGLGTGQPGSVTGPGGTRVSHVVSGTVQPSGPAPFREGMAGPALGGPDSMPVAAIPGGPSPTPPLGPPIGPGDAIGPGGLAPGTRTASTIPSIVYSPPNGGTIGGTTGAGKVTIPPSAAGSPPQAYPGVAQIPSAGQPGAASAVRLDPPYVAGRTQTDFATEGDRRPNSTGTPGPTNQGSSNGGTGAADTPSAPIVQGPSLAPGVSGASQTSAVNNAGNPGPTNLGGARSSNSPAAAGQQSSGGQPADPAAPGEKNNMPQYAPAQTQPPAKKPPPLRLAKLNGDRDYIIFIECRPEDVVLYPSRQVFPMQQLARGDTALVQAVKQMIDRKQSLVRAGDLPFRPQVRFLVHPESIRSYHTTYPLLNALGVPQTRQNLEPDDDVPAIVVGQ